MKTTRRTFLSKALLTSAVAAYASRSYGKQMTPAGSVKPPVAADFSVSIFSKNLHWLGYDHMASAAASIGFDGIDLTVRPEGHVLPERVADDLPKAVEAIRKAGLNVHMITTGINNPDDQYTEPILKTASSLGIPCYRMGWITYNDKISIDDNLDLFRSRMSGLAALNQQYNIHGDYQNHSGASFGSPVWDLWMILKDLDPKWTGAQYDVRHAVVEAANAWPLGLRLIKSHVLSLDIKDFAWMKKGNKWEAVTVPLGQGAVDFKKYLGLVKEYGIRGPFSMHFEYDLGGAENGARTISKKKDEVLGAMKRDLTLFRRLLSESGIR